MSADSFSSFVESTHHDFCESPCHDRGYDFPQDPGGGGGTGEKRISATLLRGGLRGFDPNYLSAGIYDSITHTWTAGGADYTVGQRVRRYDVGFPASDRPLIKRLGIWRCIANVTNSGDPSGDGAHWAQVDVMTGPNIDSAKNAWWDTTWVANYTNSGTWAARPGHTLPATIRAGEIFCTTVTGEFWRAKVNIAVLPGTPVFPGPDANCEPARLNRWRNDAPSGVVVYKTWHEVSTLSVTWWRQLDESYLQPPDGTASNTYHLNKCGGDNFVSCDVADGEGIKWPALPVYFVLTDLAVSATSLQFTFTKREADYYNTPTHVGWYGDEFVVTQTISVEDPYTDAEADADVASAVAAVVDLDIGECALVTRLPDCTYSISKFACPP